MSNAAQQFLEAAGTITRNLRHRGLIQTALRKYEVARDRKKSAFNDWSSARQSAAETKWDAINHLDTYLTEFTTKLESRGTKVHWCPTGPEDAAGFDLDLDALVKDRVHFRRRPDHQVPAVVSLQNGGHDFVRQDLYQYV